MAPRTGHKCIHCCDDYLIIESAPLAGADSPWTAWATPSFADAIALVRRHLWVQQGTFMPSEREHESIKVPPPLVPQDALDT